MIDKRVYNFSPGDEIGFIDNPTPMRKEIIAVGTAIFVCWDNEYVELKFSNKQVNLLKTKFNYMFTEDNTLKLQPVGLYIVKKNGKTHFEEFYETQV